MEMIFRMRSDGGDSGERVVTLTGTSHRKLLITAEMLSSANRFKFVSSKQQTTVNGKIFHPFPEKQFLISI